MDILLTAYFPVDERDLNPAKALRTIGEAHSATPFQIVCAWLVAQPRVSTIPMSQDPLHQRQNLDAADIQLTGPQLAQLA
jgi:diketogulonate reductase-like aldo/keto reductase